jgi:spermidine synthase
MLEAVAFLCGAAVMILEMTGSRIMAPYLGASVLVWTALIGVILAFLSVGYWLGGKLADRTPAPKRLAAVILGAAFSVLFIGLFHAGVLSLIASAGFRPEMGAIFAAIFLFGPASLLLGMVSPYTVRVALELRKTPVRQAGALIGRFSALSAIGSILGTFLGGYFFVSWIGSRLTIYMVASVLMSVSLLAVMAGGVKIGKNKRLVLMPVLGLIACLVFGAMQKMWELAEFRSGVVKVDTRYSRLEIRDLREPGGRILRELHTPPDLVQSGMYLDSPTELALSYTKKFALAWQLKPGSGRFLMLGGAGYSIPKYLLRTRHDITLDVVEIDPAVTELARRLFALKDDPRLTIHHEDARLYLNRYARSRAPNSSVPLAAGGWTGDAPGYDIIMGDTFSSVYNLPFQMSTVECARSIYTALDDEGLFIGNVISSVTGEKSQLLRSIRASFERVFPDVRVYPSLSSQHSGQIQNVMLVAFKHKRDLPGANDLRRRGLAPELAAWPFQAREELNTAVNLLENEWRIRLAGDLPPLYDDFAPVERYALPLMY